MSEQNLFVAEVSGLRSKLHIAKELTIITYGLIAAEAGDLRYG